MTPMDRDRIQEEQLAAMTTDREPVIGREIQVFAETASTNDLAMRLGQGRTPEGVAIFAERQTRGRGTRGRVWHAGEGLGLAFSVLLRPTWPEPQWRRLTPIAAAAVGQAVEALTDLPVQIKWPNDVYLHKRKLCGVLIETRGGTSANPGAAVMGIGLNINHQETDWPPELREWSASLRRETGKMFDRHIVAGRILERLDDLYQLAATDFPAVIDWLRPRNFLQDLPVTITNGEEISGEVSGFGDEGELLLRGPQGLIHPVISGSVVIHDMF